MYFREDGSVSSDHEITQTIVLHPNSAEANGLGGPCLTTADIEMPVLAAIRSIVDGVAPAYELDCIAALRLVVQFPTGMEVDKDLRIHLRCDGVDELQYRFTGAPLKMAAKFFSSAEAYMAVRTESVARFVYNVNCLGRALHLLTHWDGEDVHEISVALEFVEWLARNSGWRTEDLCDLRRRMTPLPGDVWPDGLDARGVWFWDRAGRTLVIDARGRLVEGLTVPERTGVAATGNPEACTRARREEMNQVFEAVIERLQGRLEASQEVERSAVDGHRPF